ncbi:MAG: glycerophosphodiester phosphodiesterase family protein [Planctomycetota bacterium]|nr:glycerophosphodiester phosphodiesterase family protein [Planctomycetota bacterium]
MGIVRISLLTLGFLGLVAGQPVQAAPPRSLVVAHRGLLRHAPENTLANFRACLELRLGFELDVCRTQDDQLVCIHDKTVDRTTNGTGPVNRFTLAELRKLDAGSWFSPTFKGEKIPTIEEVFQLLARYPRAEVLVAVDIKQQDDQVERDLVQLANRHSVLDRLLFIGNTITDAGVRGRLYQSSKSSHIAHVAHNAQELEDSIKDPQADWVYVRYLPNAMDVRRIHQQGKRVFIAGKTVSGEEVANWKVASDIGIDGILTDHALTLQALLRK